MLSDHLVIGRFYREQAALTYACQIADIYPRTDVTVSQDADGTWAVTVEATRTAMRRAEDG